MEGGPRCPECTGGGLESRQVRRMQALLARQLPRPSQASPSSSSHPGPALGRHVPWALRSSLRLWLRSRHLEQCLEQ